MLFKISIDKYIIDNMQENLVIVESPAKAKTIEKFLGTNFKVMSSCGHIRDLKSKEISIKLDTLEPIYEIPEDKKKIVAELKKNAKSANTVWLASDEDREGEAISWHLCEVLGLDENKTNRIVFHEITKSAILEAIKHPRRLNMNLVNAQQARRVLDILVGFKISPVLWRKVKPALSAGRVQSVAVRLIVERENEIQSFIPEAYYRITGIFAVTNEDGTQNELKAELNSRFKTHEEAIAFLNKCKDSKFIISDVTKKPLKRSPMPPFTTSTLQQEAAHKLGFTVSQTMMIAQQLYEAGLITYMRTDSVTLSEIALNSIKDRINSTYGTEYSKLRTYHTNSKGAQEAHEAIRPTYINNTNIDGTNQEKRLYNLIWKRAIASQMADAQINKTTINISVIDKETNKEESLKFITTGETIIFDGFLKVYNDTKSISENKQEKSQSLPQVKEGDIIERRDILSTERYSIGPSRYTEASLVHKMEELGIGRPSTYAPTISTIQKRGYVKKGDKKGTERNYKVDTLQGLKISTVNKKEMVGADKGKLIPTDIGVVVNDFLIANFPEIVDYNFTAKIEEEFDRISEGKAAWDAEMKDFYKDFEPKIEKVINSRSEHKAGEQQLGVDPKTGKPVFVKIGRFGPVVQIGNANDSDKPIFAQVPADKSMLELTLQDALDLFKLPRIVGSFEDKDVVIGIGRFGPYIKHDNKYVSLPKEEDPLTITIDKAVLLIQKKRLQDKQRHIKVLAESPKMEIMNGRYGPYIAFEDKNYRIPKSLHNKIDNLTYDEALDIINKAKEKKKKN